MKKIFFTALLIFISHTSIAANQSIPPQDQTLNCKSQNNTGMTAIWSPQFGELRVYNKQGKAIVDQDALVYGNTSYIETFPAKRSTKIIFSDDQDADALAEILQFGEVTQLLVFDDSGDALDGFFCK